MKILIPVALLYLLTACTPRITFTDRQLPIIPTDDLILPAKDSTVTGTITMLSDKFQVLDLIETSSDSAIRRARIVFDHVLQPYRGGIVTAGVKKIKDDSLGYMTAVRLLDWSEHPVDYQTIGTNIDRLIERQCAHLARLMVNQGFEAWDFSGTPVLEGYDAGKNILIFSMASRAVQETAFERYPVLIVWATPHGKLLKAELMVVNRVLERSQK